MQTRHPSIPKEREQLQCQKKLNIVPQIFTSEGNYHYNRCNNIVGTAIAADLQAMEDFLLSCRGPVGTLEYLFLLY